MVRLRRAEKRHRTTTLDRTLVGFRDQRGEREGAPILRHTVRIGIANNSGGASERQLLLFPADSLLSPLLSRSPRSGFLLSSVTRSRNTRGQWPYRPASTRAMRNKHVMLYDLNYLSKYLTPFDLRFEISNLDYPGIHVHIASNCHFGGL